VNASISLAGAGVTLAGEHRRARGSAGRTVLLLHGGGQTRHAWSRTAGALVRLGFDALTYDLRGHGESEWHPEGHYALADHAADLEAVLSSMPTSCAVVGASLGGLTGLAAAAARPDKVAGLVLVDITPKVELEGMHRIRDFMSADPEGFGSLEEAAVAVQAYQPHRSREVNLDGLRKNLRQDLEGRWRWHWDPRVLELDDPVYDDVRRHSRLAARSLTVPLLLVRGALSDIVGDEGVAELRALARQLQVADVRDAGHMVAGDDNDVFTSALVPFLERVLPIGGWT
jgi:pimeloyl-ACP methyl ester carboxylesterase